MISVTFPDGASRAFEPGDHGPAIAKSSLHRSPSARSRWRSTASLTDLADPITRDARIEFVGREDPRALELIRHDAAHVLAEAVQTLYPGTQVTIGPVIDDGFYYDFAAQRAVHAGRFPAIEAKMREIIARDRPFTKEVWSRDDAQALFERSGEAFKVELVDAIPADQDLKIYRQGEWLDLCRGPHMTSTGKVGTAFKLMKVAGAYWRGDSNNPMLSRIYGTAFATQAELDAYLHRLEEAERATIAGSAARWTCSTFQEEGPGAVFWHPKGWTLFQTLIAYMRRRLARRLPGGQCAADARQGAVGDLGPLGLVPREHVHGPVGRRRGGGRAHLRAEADELPGPRADLQARAQVLPRSAAAICGIRRGASLRAVGRAARRDAGARLHAGRRAYLLHRGSDSPPSAWRSTT